MYIILSFKEFKGTNECFLIMEMNSFNYVTKGWTRQCNNLRPFKVLCNYRVMKSILEQYKSSHRESLLKISGLQWLGKHTFLFSLPEFQNALK